MKGVPTIEATKRVVKSDALSVQTEVIAEEIKKISRAMETLNNGQLKREAIVTLIHDKSKLNKKTIELVLNNLEQLQKTWLKPVKK